MTSHKFELFNRIITRTRERCDYGQCLAHQIEILKKNRKWHTSRGNYSVYSSKSGDYYFIGILNRRFNGNIAFDPNNLDVFQVTLSCNEL